MLAARDFAKDKVKVNFYSAQYAEDRNLTPSVFELTPDLTRSVLDFGNFKEKRKLPLLKDILDRLFDSSDAEYVIYTNVDIALMPNFYLTVDRLLNEGYDAFVIRRVDIPKTFHELEDIPLMYSLKGKPNPGHDCFVFKRAAYKNYYLGAVCIGTPFVGAALFSNLIAYAQRFKAFDHLHLTFHLGSDAVHNKAIYDDYLIYNMNELKKVWQYLGERNIKKEHPWIEKIVKPYMKCVLRNNCNIPKRIFRFFKSKLENSLI